MSKTPSILIAVPGAGYECSKAYAAFGSMVGGTVHYWMKRYGDASQVAVRVTDRMAVAEARNLLMGVAIANDFDFVLWLDDDMDPPPNIVEMLMRFDRPIVSGCASKRCIPPEVMAFDFFPNKDTGKTECFQGSIPLWKGTYAMGGAGMACVLMRTEVLKYAKEKLGKRVFQYGEDPVTGERKYSTEDLLFFETVNAGGFRTIIDSECSVGHLGIHNFLPNTQDVETGKYHNPEAAHYVGSSPGC